VGIGYVGATSSGRIEDLRIVRSILQGKKVKSSFQLFVVPASQGVFRQAYTEGIIQDITEAGAIVLPPTDSSSAILAEIASNTNTATITSSNLGYVDFLANRIANIYIAAPANVALSALKGTISCLDEALDSNDTAYIPSRWPQLGTVENDRLSNGVWNYTDFNNISSSKIFSSLHSAHVNSPITIRPYLFEDFDTLFATKVSPTDIILAGDNFGCGVLKEQSITGLVYAGVKAIVAKSFSSLFYRSAINHGLFVIEHAQAIDSYQSGLKVSLDFENNEILVGLAPFDFRSFPNEILEILHAKGLINWTKQKIANKKLSSVNQ
jgi:3-isopropylmalate dehydratase small subunit